MYWIYVLQSLKDGKTYVGYTDNVERRLKEHNDGRSKSTKHRRPFRCLFTETFDTLREAKERELWWKGSGGRRRLKHYFGQNVDSLFLTTSSVKNASEIDILLGKESTFSNLHYRYDQETIDFLKRHFERPDSLYSIVRNGETFVAFCSTDSDWWEPYHFFLREIFVMPEYQGRNIGETLMRESIEHARKFVAQAIVTETAFENVPMQKLCERCGFRKWNNPQWKEGITYKLPLTVVRNILE